MCPLKSHNHSKSDIYFAKQCNNPFPRLPQIFGQIRIFHLTSKLKESLYNPAGLQKPVFSDSIANHIFIQGAINALKINSLQFKYNKQTMEEQQLSESTTLFIQYQWQSMSRQQKAAFLRKYCREILFGQGKEMATIRQEINREIYQIAESYLYKGIYEKFLGDAMEMYATKTSK